MKRQGIILITFIVSLLIFLLLPDRFIQAQDMQAKIIDLKHTRERGQDIILVSLSTDLPRGSILNCQIYALVFCPGKVASRQRQASPKEGGDPSESLRGTRLGREVEEKLIYSYLVEVDKGGQVQGRIKGFPWVLPPAIYTIKIKLAHQQRPEVNPAYSLCGGLTQHRLVIGSLEDLTKIHQHHFTELRDSYQTLAQTNLTTDKVHQILKKTGRFLLDNYPGLYRSSYRKTYRIGLARVDLATQGASEARQESIPEATNDSPPELPAPKKTISDMINKAEEELLNEAVFDFFIMLNHCAEDMKFTYEKIKTATEQKKLWIKKKIRFQKDLTEFDKYFKRFRKEVNTVEFTSQYENISNYHVLLQELLKTYSSLINEGEMVMVTPSGVTTAGVPGGDHHGTETHQQTLKKILKEIKELF